MVHTQQFCRNWLWLVILAAGTAARAAEETAAAAAPAAEESWQVLEMGGARVGYGHIATYRRTGDDGTELIVTDMLNSMRLKRFNNAFEMTIRQHTEETTDGRLLSFSFQLDNPPISSMETIGTVRGDKLELKTLANGGTDITTTDWDAGIKSPAWQERDLEEHPLQPGESRSFEMYDPQLNQVGTVTLTEKGRATTKLLDGSEIEATRIVMSTSLVPFLAIDSYLDAKGEVVKSETNLLSLITYTVDRETALRELDDQPVDLAVETLVKVEPIKNAHERKRIVYRVTVAGGAAADQFPSGATQQVKRIDDNTAEITVTSLSPKADGAPGEPQDEKYVRATRFLDCDNARVNAHAAKAAAANLAPPAAAVAMEEYVHDAMRDKNFATGLATASEVAENLEGDCTEHAVLLAAMLRARRIPARVAVGVVYSERHSAFAGHMWTEAYLNGRWTPLDATLGRGGIGAAHIKVADSALDENAPTPIAAFLPMIHLLGQMTIEVTTVE
jgi:hypothetical protein